MRGPDISTLTAAHDRDNEDAISLGPPDVAVLVDGAGLPAYLRAGCRHTVSWYSNTLARALSDHLRQRDRPMKAGLAAALLAVASSHGEGCDLSAGSPSGTVAAWRIGPDSVEYLVLGDASLLLAHRDGSVTEVTDDRLTPSGDGLGRVAWSPPTRTSTSSRADLNRAAAARVLLPVKTARDNPRECSASRASRTPGTHKSRGEYRWPAPTRTWADQDSPELRIRTS